MLFKPQENYGNINNNNSITEALKILDKKTEIISSKSEKN